MNATQPEFPPDYGYKEPPPLEICWKCRGRGLVNVRGATVECPACDGEGEYEVKPDLP